MSFVSPGTCTLEASQTGNSQYAAATPVEQTFTVGKGLQTITFTSAPPASAVVGEGTYALSANASSGLPVVLLSQTPAVCTLEGTTVAFTGAGTCTLSASEPGDAAYEPATPALQSFTVAPVPELVQVPAGGPSGSNPPGSSTTLSFTSTSTPSGRPNSSFRLISAPKVGLHTGAITFSAKVVDPGTLTWTLTFHNASAAGHAAIFAAGHMTAKTPGTLVFTARPRPLAGEALRHLAAGKGKLALRAMLSFQSALGGAPSSEVVPVSDRLR